jgi:hypothetical protein
VEPLFPGANQGRHEMLKAHWVTDDGVQQVCVLKGFDYVDLKRLRREMAVLSRFHHPNLMPLQAVCRRHDPLRYYLQLPMHPMDLKQALAAIYAKAESEDETEIASELRVVALLKGVLYGLDCLHQVRPSGQFLVDLVSLDQDKTKQSREEKHSSSTV